MYVHDHPLVSKRLSTCSLIACAFNKVVGYDASGPLLRIGNDRMNRRVCNLAAFPPIEVDAREELSPDLR